MILVRRAVSDAHCEHRHDGGEEIESGMRGFGKNAERTGEQSRDQFDRREKHCGNNTRERDAEFFLLHDAVRLFCPDGHETSQAK